MSWFNVDSLKKGLSESVKGVTEKVSASMTLDKEMLQKLTLTSPELRAERERMDEEERRKEDVKDMLAGMYPWETRDPERDILVEECKDAILRLSSDKANFTGPYKMPKLSVNLEKDDKDQDAQKSDEEESAPPALESPSKSSLERLQTLEPLPPLLAYFDLNAHVGLIQKLLAADPQLVKMQSQLSGGGEHERVFWHNYFFACAWCRYEAGLSIDEIWSDQPMEAASVHSAHAAVEGNEEEEISFAQDDVAKAFPTEPATDPSAPFGPDSSSSSPNAAAAGSTANSVSADFEMVGDDLEEHVAASAPDEAVDYELDELEAEIARELQD